MHEAVVIKVENLSKQYRLGLVGTGSLGHDINRWWAKLRGKPDPYLKIGESNDRTQQGESEYVWALKDINFEVKRGEVLGIIGRNGAGKSTLLKILSRVTAPTTGNIKVKGRIASLLEVGTGFHPELTGRENIYLNGAINGMIRAEVTRKLDEIVDFSGCERYIDTPVKRYSSGMMVRLGFAIAAHMEPEILIVDEVLAVGDAEFQKKCIGKMQDVAGHGRTVLFVSHNMISMLKLCSSGILLDHGKISFSGDIDETVNFYTKAVSVGENFSSIKFIGSLSKQVLLNGITLNGENIIYKHSFLPKDKVEIEVDFQIKIEGNCCFYIGIHDDNDIQLFTLSTNSEYVKSGRYTVSFLLDSYVFRPGSFSLGFGGIVGDVNWFWSNPIAPFEVVAYWDSKCRLHPQGKLLMPYRYNFNKA